MKRLLAVLIILFATATPSWAVLSVSATKSNQVVGTQVSVTIGIVSGDLAVAMCYSDVASSNSLSITDNVPQTWTQVPGSPVAVGNGVLVMYYKPNTATVSSVKCNATTSGTTVCVAYDIAGAATGTPLDANASNPAVSSNSANGTSLGSGTLSTSNTNDILLYAVGESATTSGWTAGSGYSLPTGSFVGSGGRGAMQNKIVSATQSSVTTSMSWTSTGGDRTGILAAFADTNQAATTPKKPPVVL